jgi:hypothetical protein
VNNSSHIELANSGQVRDIVQIPEIADKTPLTYKQKLFCQAYVYKTDGNATRAYLIVYKHVTLESAGSLSCNLLKDVRISTEIEYLRAKSEYTADKAIQECDEARKCAKKWKQSTAMVNAIMLKARIKGLITDKQDTVVRQVPVTAGDLLKAAESAYKTLMDKTSVQPMDKVHPIANDVSAQNSAESTGGVEAGRETGKDGNHNDPINIEPNANDQP